MAGPEALPPDLEAVDELCRLALAASRLGCRVLLVDVDPALQDLLVLAGVDELLLGDAPDRSDGEPGPSTSARPAPQTPRTSPVSCPRTAGSPRSPTSGRDDLVAWYLGPGAGCEGSRLLAGWANGCPAFAQYRVDPAGGHAPWALQVLELRGDGIAEVHAFLDTAECFERFGFPAHLPAS